MEHQLDKLMGAGCSGSLAAQLLWGTFTLGEKNSLSFEEYKELWELTKEKFALQKDIWTFARKKAKGFSQHHWVWINTPSGDKSEDSVWASLKEEAKKLLNK